MLFKKSVTKMISIIFIYCSCMLCFSVTHAANVDTKVIENEQVVLPDSTANQFLQEARLRNLILVSAAIVLVFIAFAIFLLVYKRKSKEEEEEAEEYKEAHLVDLFGATEQQSYHITEKPVMLGRVAGRDPEFMDYIVLGSSGIGRRHAVIEYKEHSFWLVDQGSINGSFVNDQPVRTEIRLKHGDRVRVYKDEFEFVIPGMEKEEATLIADRDSAAEEATIAVAAAGAEVENYNADEVMDLGFGTEIEMQDEGSIESSAGIPPTEMPELSTSSVEDEFDMSLEQAPEPTTEMADMLFADDAEEDDEATLLPEDVEESNTDVTISPGLDDDDEEIDDATLRPEK